MAIDFLAKVNAAIATNLQLSKAEAENLIRTFFIELDLGLNLPPTQVVTNSLLVKLSPPFTKDNKFLLSLKVKIIVLSLNISRDCVNNIYKKFALNMRSCLYLVFKLLCYVNMYRISSKQLKHYNNKQKTILANLVILLLNAVLPVFSKEGL